MNRLHPGAKRTVASHEPYGPVWWLYDGELAYEQERLWLRHQPRPATQPAWRAMLRERLCAWRCGRRTP